MADKMMNGVPLASLQGLLCAVRDDAENGKTQWRSSTTWKGGFECESTIRDYTIGMDEPEQMGGTDTAPNMVEMVLAAYGSCLTVGYAMNATLRGIQINSMKIDVEGDLDLAGFLGLSDDVPPGFSDIRVRVNLDSDADDQTILDLHEHVSRTSPVGHILNKPLSVSTEPLTG